MTSDLIDAYFIVERYMEQLDDECLADKAILVVLRMVVIEAGGPQVTTYAGFAASHLPTLSRAPSLLPVVKILVTWHEAEIKIFLMLR